MTAWPETYALERERMMLDAVRRGEATIAWREIAVGGRLRARVLADAIRWDVAGRRVRLGSTPYSYQQIADLIHAVMPTPRMVDIAAREAHEAAGLLAPMPRPISDRTSAHVAHSSAIDAAAAGRAFVRAWKAWCLSLDVWRKYGYATNYAWHVHRTMARAVALRLEPSVSDPDLLVVQGPYEAHTIGASTDDDPEAEVPGHGDYSQLVGDLWLDACELDGRPALISEIMTGRHGAEAAALISHEGALPDHRLPGVPLPRTDVEPEAPVMLAVPPRVTVNAAVSGGPLLRRGSRGALVGELQRRLGLAEPTDYFGPVTERMVLAYQAAVGLVVDGIVGPRTWAALPTTGSVSLVRVAPRPDVLERMAWRQARHYRPGRREPIQWITCHTAEVREVAQAAESLMAACATWERLASWHVAIDCDSAARSVRDDDTAFAAGPGNDGGLHVEISGYARQTAEDWRDPYSRAELGGVGRPLLAMWSELHGIPLRRVTAEQLLPGQEERGVVDHATWSAACVLAQKRDIRHPRYWDAVRQRWRTTNHADCGPAFWGAAAPQLGIAT